MHQNNINVSLLCSRDQVSKPDCGERDKGEVAGLHDSPVLPEDVDGGAPNDVHGHDYYRDGDGHGKLKQRLVGF
jgi:hypothetical protein